MHCTIRSSEYHVLLGNNQSIASVDFHWRKYVWNFKPLSNVSCQYQRIINSPGYGMRGPRNGTVTRLNYVETFTLKNVKLFL